MGTWAKRHVVGVSAWWRIVILVKLNSNHLNYWSFICSNTRGKRAFTVMFVTKVTALSWHVTDTWLRMNLENTRVLIVTSINRTEWFLTCIPSIANARLMRSLYLKFSLSFLLR